MAQPLRFSVDPDDLVRPDSERHDNAILKQVGHWKSIGCIIEHYGICDLAVTDTHPEPAQRRNAA